MAFLSPTPMARATIRRLARQMAPSSRLSSPPTHATAPSPFSCCQRLTTLARQPKPSLPVLSSLCLSQLRIYENTRVSQNHSVASTRSASNSSAKKKKKKKKATPPPPAPNATKNTPPDNKKDASSSSSSSSSSSDSSARRPFFPDRSSKSVAYWLLGSAASVFGIVVFGGLTRLTESGLSITEWRPVTGSLPPMSPEDWESEFAKYRASPEYIKLNPNMNLEEFKKIYFMEWAHRLWGRLIGLGFVLPAVYFVARRRVSAPMAWNLAGISALIGVQGAIGWWMVASGLGDDLLAEGAHPRVSQYRLTAHLATAFVCYSWMLLSGLSVLRAHRLAKAPGTVTALRRLLHKPSAQRFRRAANAVTALIFVTVLTGALVAGLDAGLIYNEFPTMGAGLTPPAAELWDRFYARRADGADLWWRNMLENPSLVQLDHRIMAMTVCASVLALFAYSRTRSVRAALPDDARKATMGLLHVMLAQVTLGISTLIYMVPTHLAAMHQAGALALLTGALVLGSRLRVPGHWLAAVRRSQKAQAKKHK